MSDVSEATDRVTSLVRAENAGSELSAEQEVVLSDILGSNDNVFITGKAGSGKSTLLRELMKKTKWPVCASTGVAAANIGGVTMHSFLSIGTGEKSVKELAWKVREHPAWEVPVLIIDEISMISAELLDKLDEIAQIVRCRDAPFGGMRIIMFGDMLQLPPVQGKMPFLSALWKSVRTITLQTIYRQKDSEFINILGELRYGNISKSSRQLIASKSKKTESQIKLRSTNAEINEINEYELGKIDTPLFTFKARDKGQIFALKDMLIPEILTVKVGARVMCLINDISHRVYNGQIGTVTEIKNAFVHVRFDGRESIIGFGSSTREITSGSTVIASRTQIPLRLAYAITIHKSQGMTFDAADIDVSRCFAPGQVYVALSRLSSLENSHIEGFEIAKIYALPVALYFELGERRPVWSWS